eukprot:TRINITY_DN25106_c0_g1_i1.p1 TRINITY_DN25106_c0_g1~~TRINITY_DN25106_c0_g1_i1.p1  ORF type:complete len:646 (+),score=99.24 TRINITY_DN25106_c0_g1_i1:39-1940(+)
MDSETIAADLEEEPEEPVQSRPVQRPRSSFIEAVHDLHEDITQRYSSTKTNLKAGFINIEKTTTQFEDVSGLAKTRRFCDDCLNLAITDTVLGCIICADVILGWVELDINAAGGTTPPLANTLIGICFSVYVTELVANMFVRRSRTCQDPWINLDIVIVLGGAVDYMVQTANLDVGFVGMLRFFRLFRIVRLLRVLHKFQFLRELKKLVAMSASCMKTLFWSFIFCFTLMVLWGMVTVSLVFPVARALRDSGGYQGCPECADQMSTVLRATMLFFKLSVIGDQWGIVVEPLMEHEPWTAIVFICASLSIVFGVLNLIVAVVVDEFADRRANDFMAKAKELDEAQQKDEIGLRKIFKMVDQDDDGELSLEELVAGARRVPEFRNRLRAMDIDESDVKQLFAMLDDDGSGTIDPSEFLGTLSRWLHESKTASRFVKYQIDKVSETQQVLKDMMVSLFGIVDSKLANLQSANANTRSSSKERASEQEDAIGELYDQTGKNMPNFEECQKPIMPAIPDDIPTPTVPLSHGSWSWRRASRDDAAAKDLQRALEKASEAIAECLQAAQQQSFEWKQQALPPSDRRHFRHSRGPSAELVVTALDSLKVGLPTVGLPTIKDVSNLEAQPQELPEKIRALLR